ncbi:MAG TPA: DUF4231 domain-containing protein [Gemmatimonadales bacterium]|nr:DUF4231 domain-containing protein [Gemmatimonadales bacterium]
MPTLEERITRNKEVLDKTLKRVKDEATIYTRRAGRERFLYTAFSGALAVLAVATPALVTYQSQVDNPTISLVAILVSAVAGAGTALQATFRWGERFRRTRLTALELDELASATQLQEHDILDSEDKPKVFQKVYELNQSAARQLQAILRRHTEAEVALVTQPAEPPRPALEPGAA